MRKSTKPAVLITNGNASAIAEIINQLSSDYDCISAENIEKAMDTVKKLADPVPAVICDVTSQKDGLTLANNLRLYCPEIVCILMTTDSRQAVEVLEDGRDFYLLQKPFSCDELKRVVKSALEEHRRRMLQKTFTWKVRFNDQNTPNLIMGPGSLAATGYRAGEFQLDKTLWKSIIVSQDIPRMDEFISCIQTQQPVDAIDFRIRRKDMRSRWLKMAFLTEQCANTTNSFEVEGFFEDITEQKEMELAILQANKRYERMASNVPGLVFHCLLQIDGSLRFTFISPSCRQLFNLEPEQICTDSELLLKSFLPEDLARLYRSIAESTAALEPFTWQGLWQHGEKRIWFQVNARPERLDDGQVLWDGVMIDITAMKEAQQSAQFLAMFPAENPNPELRISKDGVIMYANPAAKLLLDNWQRDAGQQVPEDIVETVNRTIHSGRTTTAETLYGDRYYSIMFVPVSQNQAVNLYARDITEIKTAELELQETKRKMNEHDKLKGEFISTITHELRTPLCIFKNIISNTLAGVNGPVTPKLQENLEMAQKSVERLKNIIADFMDISEIDAGKTKLDRRITFMQDLIKQTVESMRPLAAAKKISLTMNLPKKPVFADIDQARIVKVLENLIGNAIKFIHVKCSIYVTVTDYLNGEFFDVCVRDDGPGMTKKEASKVFDRFVQARILKGPGKHGTGLGLTIAREILNLHGGHIWVETEPKQGCAFFFRLPKAKEKTAAAPAGAAPAAQA